jgi:hypothetical protein
MSRQVEATILYVVSVAAVILVIWTIGWFFARSVEDIKVVKVEPGVHCAVTSRMFNTSIDCWRVDDE